MGETLKHLEVSPSDYHSKLLLNREDIFAEDSYLSKSAMSELKDSSLWKWRHHPKKYNSDSMRWGSLIDCLLTTPEEFDDLYEVANYPTFQSNAAQAWCKEVEDGGKVALLKCKLEDAKKSITIFPQHYEANRIIKNSQKQCILFGKYTDPDYKRSINLKGLADFIPNDRKYLADLKTTGKFTRKDLKKTIYDYQYHVQAAFYLMLYNKANPNDKRDRFRIVWQQSVAPYEVAVQELTLDDIKQGQLVAKYYLRKLTRAYALDEFPMMCGDRAEMVSMPEWCSISDEMMIEDMDVIEAPKK